MRATTKGISSVRGAVGFQLASARTFGSDTRLPSQLRRTDSSTSRMDTGSRETGAHAGLFQLRQRHTTPPAGHCPGQSSAACQIDPVLCS